jgi:hypothetical protein
MSPDSLNMQLPNRTKSGPYGSKLGGMEQVPTPNSEMDFSPAADMRRQKSPGHSYKDASSSSHASFTPPTGDSASTSGVGSLSKGSPSGSNMPTPGSLAAAAAASDSLFFEMADASFSTFQQSQYFSAAGPLAFGASPSQRVSVAAATAASAAQSGVSSIDVAMASTAASAGGGWDMGGRDAAGSSTGLSPMATESWSDVLSGVADWSGVAGEHQGFGTRARRA